MSKYFLFVEEELVFLFAMRGKTSFFCDLACETVFLW